MRLEDIGGLDGTPAFDVVTRAPDSEVESTTRYTAATARRVDARSLEADLACSGGEVKAVGRQYLGVLFQLAICPRAEDPGFAVSEIVPVLLPGRLATLGERYPATGEVSSDGQVTWTFALDDTEVSLRSLEGAERFALTVQLGAAQPSAFLVDSYRLEELPPPVDETLRMRSADDSVTVVLRRRWAAQGIGHSSIYAPLSVSVSYEGGDHFIDGLDELDYVNTHHNWEDALTATRGEEVVSWYMTLNINEPDPDFLVYEVSARVDDEVTLPPTRVYLDP